MSSETERLKELAQTERQDGSQSPPHMSDGFQAPDAQKVGSEKPAKLTVEQVNSQLLSVITTCNTSLTGKMWRIWMDIGLLQQDMQNIIERVTKTESRISTLEDNLSPFPSRVSAAEKQISSWCQKADNLENRLRRNNVKIVGLPERAEGQNHGDC